MITLNSKTAKVLFAVLASFVINFAWQNAWRVPTLLGIPSLTVLNSFVKDLALTLVVFVISSIVVVLILLFNFVPEHLSAQLDNMKIIYNRFIPFKGFLAINLFGVLFVRGAGRDISARVMNHEKIHSAQMKELGYVLFYVIYILEWLYRLTQTGNAYQNISFEREAYDNEGNMAYLRTRSRLAMWRRK